MRTTTGSSRRDDILDAVDRLLGAGGVHAVTMRKVAAEAGVSLRLVQYYGTNKDTLLTGPSTEPRSAASPAGVAPWLMPRPCVR